MKVRKLTPAEVRFAAALLVALAAVFIPLAGWGINWTPSEGEQTGYLLKIQPEGSLFPTWEGRLLCEGRCNGSGPSGGRRLEFTVEADMASRVQELKRGRGKVILRYQKVRFYSPLRSASRGIFLASIRLAPEQ